MVALCLVKDLAILQIRRFVYVAQYCLDLLFLALSDKAPIRAGHFTIICSHIPTAFLRLFDLGNLDNHLAAALQNIKQANLAAILDLETFALFKSNKSCIHQ